MAVSYANNGTLPTDATSIDIGYPASISAGDKLIMFVVTKYGELTTTPVSAGFSLIATMTAGDGLGPGAGQGDVRLYAYEKTATGSESGTVTVAKGAETGSVIHGNISRFTKSLANWATTQYTTGTDTNANSAWTISGGSVTLAPGSLVLALAAGNDAPSDMYEGSPNCVASGITFAVDQTTYRKSLNSATGDRSFLSKTVQTVASGTATTALSFNAVIGSPYPEGGTILVVLSDTDGASAAVAAYARGSNIILRG